MAHFPSAMFLRRALRGAALATVGLSVAGCSLFSSSDKRYEPVPLTPITAEVTAGIGWTVPVGRGGGVGFAPVVVGDAVYAAAADGAVVKANVADGQVAWRTTVEGKLLAGVGSDGMTTAVVTPRGEVIAFDDNGQEKWRARATSEVLVPPVVGDGLVVVRSGDYRVQAFDANSGERRWSMQRPGPALALRTVNHMTIAGGFVFTGLPGGKVVAIHTDNGVVQWEGTVAIPKGVSELERVADVVGGPVLGGSMLCAAAYQGRIACFNVQGGGQIAWARDFSGAAGLTIDSSSAFAPDADGVVHGFLLSGGTNIWKQDALKNRRLSAPASFERAVAVGDFEGFVHLLAREDGRLIGRVATGGGPILAQPIATPYGVVVQGSDGSLRLVTVGN